MPRQVPLATGFSPGEKGSVPLGLSFRSHCGDTKQLVTALASWHRHLPSPRGILPPCLAVGHRGWPRASPWLCQTTVLRCPRQAGGKEPNLGTPQAPGAGAGSSSALAAHLGTVLSLPPVTAEHRHRCQDCWHPRKIHLPLENTSSNFGERQHRSNPKNFGMCRDAMQRAAVVLRDEREQEEIPQRCAKGQLAPAGQSGHRWWPGP